MSKHMHEWNFREFGCPCFFDILFTVTAPCLHTKDQEMARKLLPRDFQRKRGVLWRSVTLGWNLSRTENKMFDLAILLGFPYHLQYSNLFILHRRFFIHFQTLPLAMEAEGITTARVYFIKSSVFRAAWKLETASNTSRADLNLKIPCRTIFFQSSYASIELSYNSCNITLNVKWNVTYNLSIFHSTFICPSYQFDTFFLI